MSRGERDVQRKMRRTLQLTIQGEFGLTEGEAWWLDRTEITFWCPEELVPGHLHAVRVDMLQQGGTVDVKARISEVYTRKQARIRHGCLHVAIYETARPQDRKSLDALISRLNPEAAEAAASESSGVSAPGTSSTSRATKAKKRIAANRARRRKAASHMPETGDRLGVSHQGAATTADEPAAESPVSEASASSSSRSRSRSGVRSRSEARSRSESRSRAAPEPPAPPAAAAEPPEPPPPPDPPAAPAELAQASEEGERPPPSEASAGPEPVGAPSEASAPPKDRSRGRRKKQRRDDRVSREERQARHRARMAAMGGNSASSSRSRRSRQDRRTSSGRRREDPPSPPSQAPPSAPPSEAPATGKPRSTSEFMRHRRRPTDSVSELSEGPVARTEPARMPEPQPAPAGGAAMVPVNAMLSPGDPPSVFVQFSSPDQVRGAIHGEAPRPRCLLQGVGELSSGDRVAAAFQLPTMAFVQIAGRVLAVDGDRATLELSSNNPQDIASLLAARR